MSHSHSVNTGAQLRTTSPQTHSPIKHLPVRGGGHPSVMKILPDSLQTRLVDATQCLICERLCQLHSGQYGYCSAIINRDSHLYSTAYGVIGEANVVPIETKVYHFKPGTQTLSLGGIGCNLRCAFCQNWEISFRDASAGGNISIPNAPPESVIELALDNKCQGIAWSHNEPTISPIYILDCAKLAKNAGLYTVLVTNGMMTRETMDLIGPWIDVYRVDVKSIDNIFYQRVAGTKRIKNILPIAAYGQQEYGIHIETVTNLMPGFNDSDDHLNRLTKAIVESLGATTPWQCSTFIPYAFMTDVPPTPIETLQHAKKIGLTNGLTFVYTDSPAHTQDRHTFCQQCQTLLVERRSSHTIVHALDTDGRCTKCHTPSLIIM